MLSIYLHGMTPYPPVPRNFIMLTHPRYALAAATSIMFWMVVKKPPTDVARKVRQNKEWS